MTTEPPQPWVSGLDIPLTVTFFRDALSRVKHQATMTLRDLVPRLRDTRGPDKASLPWLKLAEFGERRTDRGSLRNNDNIISIFGVEADYDASAITLDRCRQIVSQAALAAIIYTSPSHTPTNPKWRILCPTSCAVPPADRAALLARLNGLFVGALAPESFTLSQSYYYGAVGVGQFHEVILLDGRPIDLASELAAGAIGRPTPAKLEPAPYVASVASVATGEATNYGRRALAEECASIRHAPDGGKHAALNKAAYSIGGLVAGGDIDQAFALDQLRAALSDIRHRCQDYAHAERTLKTAFEDGLRAPRQKPDRPPSAPRAMPFGIGAATWRPKDGEQIDEETGEVLPAHETTLPAPMGAPKAPVLWIDADAWDETDIPKRPWLAAGYLMRAAVSALSGQGSGGKSSLVVCWTVALACGETVGAFQPTGRMKVVNYNVEDDQLEQRRRYSAALKAAGKTPADIAGQVVRCGPETIGTLFERDAQTGRIVPTEAMKRLEALCQETGADVLICDPLAELHNAEENDNTGMRAVVAAFRALAKRLNIAVLLLHHDRKGNNAPGDMDRLRGASAITGAVRVLLTLTSMSVEEAERYGVQPDERRRHFRIDGAKSNYAIAQDAEWWRLAGYPLTNGEEVAACRPWAPPSAFEGLTMADCIAILEFIAAGENGCPYGTTGKAKRALLDALEAKFHMNEALAKVRMSAWIEQQVIQIAADQPSPNSNHKRNGYIINIQKLNEMRRQG